MEIILYFGDVGELHDPALFQALYRSVSGSRREKIDRLRSEKGRLLSLGAGALLEAALAECGVSSPRFEADENGKPFLPDRDDLFFNLSHSGSKVFCAVSDRAVGCDVEQIRSAKLRIARRYFCEEEYRALLACADEAARDRLFYRYWTLKECFLKATGFGLSLPMNRFCFLLDGDSISIRQSVDERPYAFRTFSVDGYQFAVCSAERTLNGVRLSARSFRELALGIL